MQKTPILFIHYGDTPYLTYTLSSAQYFNHDKEVFLLGDSRNKKYEKKLKIKHIPFTQYDHAESVTELHKNFKYIAGINRQTEQDKRFEFFCFKRWHYLYEFMKEHCLEKCWYFDSDTLILSNLNNEESKFDSFDITEQSNGSNMKGLIKFKQIENFVKTINRLFLDNVYLNKQRAEFVDMPNYAFCDMRAYLAFKETYTPKTIALKTILYDETHDENICQEDGMETEYNNYLKRVVKKLYFIDNNVYEKSQKTGRLIKLITINMSWVPTSFIEKVYYYKVHGEFPPFYISLFLKIHRIPRYIKTRLTKETK